MIEFKEVVINIKGESNRQKEIEKLAIERNISKEKLEKKISKMYIKEGEKYEKYI